MVAHREIEEISDERLNAYLATVDHNLFVYWTGGAYRAQEGSARSEALKLVTEIKTLARIIHQSADFWLADVA